MTPKTTQKVSTVKLFAMLRDLEKTLLVQGDTAEAFIVGQEKQKVMHRLSSEYTSDSYLPAVRVEVLEECFDVQLEEELGTFVAGSSPIDWGDFKP